jgi:4-hydroxybenzoate polyprenyltransferase
MGIRIRSLLELGRVSNLPTVWTNALAGVVLSGAPWRPAPAFAAAASLSCLYLGGMCLNDCFDVEEDRVLKPWRPIPSGRVSIGAAKLAAAALFASALGLLVVVAAWRALFAASVLLAVIVLYDWIHRRHPATVLLMAACRAMTYPVAALAAADAVAGAVGVVAALQFAYVVVLSLVARWDKATARSVPFAPMPWLLAGISLVDGAALALLAHPAWLLAGLAGAALTRAGQPVVRGD